MIFNAQTPVITIEGKWSVYRHVTDLRSGRVWLSFDIRVARPLSVKLPSLPEQCEHEIKYGWQRVSEKLEANDVREATAQKNALKDKQERIWQNQVAWETQAFQYNTNKRRWVSCKLNLEPSHKGEPIAMPSPFQVLVVIQRIYDAGVTEPMVQIHIHTEANMHFISSFWICGQTTDWLRRCGH
jgi:hypothetical protein